jgi:hypothetical protein
LIPFRFNDVFEHGNTPTIGRRGEPPASPASDAAPNVGIERVSFLTGSILSTDYAHHFPPKLTKTARVNARTGSRLASSDPVHSCECNFARHRKPASDLIGLQQV